MYSEKKPPIAPPHFHPNPPRQYRKKDVPKGSFEPPPPLPLKPLRRETEELPKLAMSQEANVHKNVCFEESATYEAVDTAQDYQVAVALENIAENNPAVEDTSDDDGGGSSVTVSGRSEISNAPSVEHFNISFEFKKTFREHNGARVIKKYHRVLKKVYNGTLSWTYNILLFVFGIILAIFWALINALVAILQTWFISPLMRVSLVIIRGLLPIILEPLGLFLKMCAKSCGCETGCMDGLTGLQNQFKLERRV